MKNLDNGNMFRVWSADSFSSVPSSLPQFCL